MKQLFALFFGLACVTPCLAGGSISWDEVSSRLSHSAPELLRVINDSFDVAPVGGAIRLGSRSLDVMEGRAEVGTRVPPYEFDAKPKGKLGPFILRIGIDDWDDGWKFTVRMGSSSKPNS